MSPDSRSTISLAKTLCYKLEGFDFETLEQENGRATVIKFRLEDPHYNAGDVLALMDDEEIPFHGMIGQIADGWAIATDRRSLLKAVNPQ
jgi:hypothetical protein